MEYPENINNSKESDSDATHLPVVRKGEQKSVFNILDCTCMYYKWINKCETNYRKGGG